MQIQGSPNHYLCLFSTLISGLGGGFELKIESQHFWYFEQLQKAKKLSHLIGKGLKINSQPKLKLMLKLVVKHMMGQLANLGMVGLDTNLYKDSIFGLEFNFQTFSNKIRQFLAFQGCSKYQKCCHSISNSKPPPKSLIRLLNRHKQ